MLRVFANRISFAGPPAVPQLLAFYLAYMVAAGFGHWLMVIPGIPITVWPPNGVTLAALLTNERRSWPWWIALAAVGELTSNILWFHNPIIPAIGYVTANALEVLTAAFSFALLFATPLIRLTTLPQVLAFLGIGVVAAPMIGATIGSAINDAVGKNPFTVTWPFWWLGDATGILIAAPLVISAINAIRERSVPTYQEIAEAGAIGAILTVLGAWIFFGDRPYAFILLLPVLWAALRFEMRGTTLAVLMLLLLIGFYAQRAVPSEPTDSQTNIFATAQLFMIVAASTGLMLAAIVRQHRQAVIDLGTANSELEQRVIERTREISAAERRFKTTFENAAVGMSIIDPEGVIIKANDGLVSMLGYEASELEGRPLDKFTHPDDLPANNLAWEKLRSGAADNYALEKRYIRKDGDVLWGQTSVSCVRKSNGEIEYLIKVIQNVTARKHSDEMRQILMHEVNHRSKNLLSVIQAIARQTAAKSPQAFVENFGARLRAIAANQDLLIKSGWERISLEDLVRSQLAHFADFLDDRFFVRGPSILLSAQVAQTLGMAIHELATNAVKYGSLSKSSGRVHVTWTSVGDQFEMSWIETKGPKIKTPKTGGFGSIVIDSMVKSIANSEVSIEFLPTGLLWRLRAPLSVLGQ